MAKEDTFIIPEEIHNHQRSTTKVLKDVLEKDNGMNPPSKANN